MHIRRCEERDRSQCDGGEGETVPGHHAGDDPDLQHGDDALFMPAGEAGAASGIFAERVSARRALAPAGPNKVHRAGGAFVHSAR